MCNDSRKTLLTIDWVFFVPEDDGHLSIEEDFFIYNVWDILAVYNNLHNRLYTSGYELEFWERLVEHH